MNNTWLQRAILQYAQLEKASLWSTQSEKAILQNAQLQGADLQNAQLQGADLRDAQLQGAFLWKAQLQGAKLKGAQLQGISSKRKLRSLSFEDRITNRISKDSDFKDVIFAGGLNEDEVKEIMVNIRKVPGITKKEIQSFQEELAIHIGQPESHELPKGAIGGQYDEAQAKEWIQRYDEATGERAMHVKEDVALR